MRRDWVDPITKHYGIWEWVGGLLIVLLILNIIGFALSLISKLWFWVIIAAVGYVAYYGLPQWKGKPKV